MTDKMNKLNENQLEQVVGGKKRYVQNVSGADRVRIIANGTTWTKATSATQMANASTAELTAMTGYSLKTAAG